MYNKNILLVDDDQVMLELLQHMLEDFITGKVFSYSSSIQALRFLQRIDREEVNLVISDWQMPDLNGMEFLRSVREIDKKMPFLMLTSNASKELVIGSKHAGVTDFIAKPFNAVDLVAKVKFLIRDEQ